MTLQARDAAAHPAPPACTAFNLAKKVGSGMKKLWTSLALAVSALTLSLGAQAGVLRATLDFEAPIDPGGAPFLPYLTHDNVFTQPGLAGHDVFFNPFSNSALAQPGDLVGEVIDGALPSTCAGIACPVNNGSKYVNMYDDAVLAFASVDGFRFSVKSFKASFIGNSDPTFAIPGAIRLRGVRDNVITDFTAFFNGPDTQGNLNFATFTTTGAFANTEFDLVFAYGFACLSGSGTGCQAFASDRGQFAIDDIVVEHVPEPASLALLGAAGLAALGARRRRTV